MISPAMFRARAAELIRNLLATDEGQVVVEAVAWTRRQLEAER